MRSTLYDTVSDRYEHYLRDEILAEVGAKSVRKKMKDKAFARSVNRDDIVNGARELGVDLDEHIAFCIEAMKRIAPQLGL